MEYLTAYGKGIPKLWKMMEYFRAYEIVIPKIMNWHSHMKFKFVCEISGAQSLYSGGPSSGRV
jgi:hypothetical protein